MLIRNNWHDWHWRITHRGRNLLLLLGCLALVSCTKSEAKEPAQLSLQACNLTLPTLSFAVEAKCGKLQVPENWDKATGRKISLRVAVVPASGKQTKPDPLFFFTGGPGQAATESYPTMARGFRLINKMRDIVVIDQRGTGKSNPLRCKSAPVKDLGAEPTPAEMTAQIKKCVKSFKGDLRQYTTTASIRDFNAVRKALGYKKINIYGISYGTRVAQAYMRRYKAHVRTVILDGVIPQPMVLGWDTSINAPARVRRWMLSRCRADKHCHKAFPKLKEALDGVEQLIKAQKDKVTMIHPRTHQAIPLKLSWSSWGLGFRLFGYTSQMMAVLPLLIHTSHKRRDVRPLMKWVLAQMESLQKAIGSLENSVICTEDWPFVAAEKARWKARYKDRPLPYGQKRLELLPLLCNNWPHKPVNADFKKPVVSSIPTLLLSGQYDPVTPPAFATRVAKHLKNSVHVIVPGEGHGAIGHSCVPKLAAKLVKSGAVKGIDPACVKKHQPLGFFIDFAGPELAK